MRKVLLMMLMAGTVAVSSCSKDDDDDTTTTPQSKFTGSWQKTKEESRTSSGNWTDETETCHLDDVEEYLSSGKWTLYDGTNQCTAGTGMTTGTWKEAASGSKIIYTYDGAGGEYESTVEEITATTMVLSHSTGATNGEQRRTTYKKK